MDQPSLKVPVFALAASLPLVLAGCMLDSLIPFYAMVVLLAGAMIYYHFREIVKFFQKRNFRMNRGMFCCLCGGILALIPFGICQYYGNGFANSIFLYFLFFGSFVHSFYFKEIWTGIAQGIHKMKKDHIVDFLIGLSLFFIVFFSLQFLFKRLLVSFLAGLFVLGFCVAPDLWRFFFQSPQESQPSKEEGVNDFAP